MRQTCCLVLAAVATHAWSAPAASGSYDVRDWGAVPTGAADSTDAIQGAVSAALGNATHETQAVVLFPSGTYKIERAINLTAPEGVSGASGVALRGVGVAAVVQSCDACDVFYGPGLWRFSAARLWLRGGPPLEPDRLAGAAEAVPGRSRRGRRPARGRRLARRGGRVEPRRRGSAGLVLRGRRCAGHLGGHESGEVTNDLPRYELVVFRELSARRLARRERVFSGAWAKCRLRSRQPAHVQRT